MAKIHGIVYFIIGLFVAIASYKINYNNLYPFLYVGLLFVVYGVAKIIIGFINKEDKKEAIPPNSHKNQLNQFKQIPKQQYKRCQTCGNAARSSDNFCARCGNRMY